MCVKHVSALGVRYYIACSIAGTQAVVSSAAHITRLKFDSEIEVRDKILCILLWHGDA
jgi:hypothetical protein